MEIQYRKLTAEDVEAFVEMRNTQFREEGAKEDVDLRPALYDYYGRHIIAMLSK